jgi:hypothetical protein
VESNIVARSPNVAAQGFWAWAKIGLGAHNALISASADVAFYLGPLFHRGWKDWRQHQKPQQPRNSRVWPHLRGRAAQRWVDRLAHGRPSRQKLRPNQWLQRVLGLGDCRQPPPKGVLMTGWGTSWPGGALGRAEVGPMAKVGSWICISRCQPKTE